MRKTTPLLRNILSRFILSLTAVAPLEFLGLPSRDDPVFPAY